MKISEYLLPPPDEPDSDDEICVTFRIPDNAAYRAAAVGAIMELGKWWNWEREATHRATQTAALMREKLARTLSVGTGVCLDNTDAFPVWEYKFNEYQYPELWVQNGVFVGGEMTEGYQWTVTGGFRSGATPTFGYAGHSISLVRALPRAINAPFMWIGIDEVPAYSTLSWCGIDYPQFQEKGNHGLAWYGIANPYLPDLIWDLVLTRQVPQSTGALNVYGIKIMSFNQPYGAIRSVAPSYTDYL